MLSPVSCYCPGLRTRRAYAPRLTLKAFSPIMYSGVFHLMQPANRSIFRRRSMQRWQKWNFSQGKNIHGFSFPCRFFRQPEKVKGSRDKGFNSLQFGHGTDQDSFPLWQPQKQDTQGSKEHTGLLSRVFLIPLYKHVDFFFNSCQAKFTFNLVPL